MTQFTEYHTLKTFWLSHEAITVKSYLESEDIDCYLKDELTINADPLLSNAIGGVKLQVSELDFARAYKLLKEKGYFDKEEVHILDKLENKLNQFLKRYLRFR